jgi:hypothetical protein
LAPAISFTQPSEDQEEREVFQYTQSAVGQVYVLIGQLTFWRYPPHGTDQIDADTFVTFGAETYVESERKRTIPSSQKKV